LNEADYFEPDWQHSFSKRGGIDSFVASGCPPSLSCLEFKARAPREITFTLSEAEIR
jgi:hypothetical protein